MGIEPTPSAWKAEVLPLNYTRLVSPRQPDFYHGDGTLSGNQTRFFNPDPVNSG